MTLLVVACDVLPRPGDTLGVQRSAAWDQRGRLVIETDSVMTLVRMRVETLGVTSRHDVLLTRFEFDPSDGVGDEYALALALDLGRADTLRPNRSYPLGPAPAGLPAAATVACLCRPLRPDSVRGALAISTRGQRMITGRVDAVLYFTPWDDPTRPVTYRLQQRIFGVRP
ncbi:MAG: hypothetical protein ACREMV_13295 [Gemmatimonadales bacterium]